MLLSTLLLFSRVKSLGSSQICFGGSTTPLLNHHYRLLEACLHWRCFVSEDRDMSEVECIGSLPNRTLIFSVPALLRVQGLLDSFIIGNKEFMITCT